MSTNAFIATELSNLMTSLKVTRKNVIQFAVFVMPNAQMKVTYNFTCSNITPGLSPTTYAASAQPNFKRNESL